MKLTYIKQTFIAFSMALAANTSLLAAQQNKQTVIFPTENTLALINAIETKHTILSSLQAAHKYFTDAPTTQSAIVYGCLGAGSTFALINYWRSIGAGLYTTTESLLRGLVSASHAMPLSLTAGTCLGLGVFGYSYWQSAGIKVWRAATKFKAVYRHVSNDNLFKGNVTIEDARGYISQHFANNLDAAIAHYQDLAHKMIEIQRFFLVGLQDISVKAECEQLLKEANRYEVRLAEILTVLRNLETAERLRAVAINNPAAVRYQVSNPA